MRDLQQDIKIQEYKDMGYSWSIGPWNFKLYHNGVYLDGWTMRHPVQNIKLHWRMRKALVQDNLVAVLNLIKEYNKGEGDNEYN